MSRARPSGSASAEAARPSSTARSVTVDSRVSGDGQLAADHELGQLRGGHVAGQDGGDRGAAPDDGDLVGDLEHLVELVRDEDDRQALGLELAQGVEELVDLLRHEDGGRLVEDQRAGAAVEHLEDLDPLPVADAELLDQGVGVDVEAVAVGDLRDLALRAAPKSSRALRVGSAAEDDVLEHREVVGELEVLVHHADPAAIASAGECMTTTARRRWLIVPLVGAVHPVEGLHQRRLAGAVLADDGVHRPAPHAQVDVVVGHDAGEALGDARELDGRRASSSAAVPCGTSVTVMAAPLLVTADTGPARERRRARLARYRARTGPVWVRTAQAVTACRDTVIVPAMICAASSSVLAS